MARRTLMSSNGLLAMLNPMQVSQRNTRRKNSSSGLLLRSALASSIELIWVLPGAAEVIDLPGYASPPIRAAGSFMKMARTSSM